MTTVGPGPISFWTALLPVCWLPPPRPQVHPPQVRASALTGGSCLWPAHARQGILFDLSYNSQSHRVLVGLPAPGRAPICLLNRAPDSPPLVLPPASQMALCLLSPPPGACVIFEEVWVLLAILQKSNLRESLGGGLAQISEFGFPLARKRGPLTPGSPFLPKPEWVPESCW